MELRTLTQYEAKKLAREGALFIACEWRSPGEAWPLGDATHDWERAAGECATARRLE